MRHGSAADVSDVPAALDKVVAFPARSRSGKLADGDRPSRRAWRAGLQRADRSSTTPCSSGSTLSFPSRPCISPTISPRSALCRQRQPQLLAGCLLRHRLSSRSSRGRRPLRPSRSSSTQEGVRRYGFHGLSYEYIAEPAAGDCARNCARVGWSSPISAAAPPCARSLAGKSVESTMGFTALDGLPMGTRPGQLDPASCSIS